MIKNTVKNMEMSAQKRKPENGLNKPFSSLLGRTKEKAPAFQRVLLAEDKGFEPSRRLLDDLLP